MDTIFDIIIVGGGWYGCHIANKLQSKYKILIIEKSSDIFNGSSYYNQNRLHLGFHYARNYETRNLCQSYYDRFKSEYEECIEDIEDNYYGISSKSIICSNTYLSIFRHEDFDFTRYRDNEIFTNLCGDPIKVDEKVINASKVKKLMKKLLSDVTFIFNEEVKEFIEKDEYIIINDKYKSKILFDCTYNQMMLTDTNYDYELTLSLIYKKIKNFGAITIVDGNFCSLYPREDNIYTLTDVEHTPIVISKNFNEIKDYIPTEEEIEIKKTLMEEKIFFYYPSFYESFEYISYFTSFKTKKVSGSDSRGITITKLSNRILSVNCGKIYGIFEWEDYIMNFLIENSDKFK